MLNQTNHLTEYCVDVNWEFRIFIVTSGHFERKEGEKPGETEVAVGQSAALTSV